MDDRRFDDLTRALGRASSRRQVFKAFLSVAVGGAFARFERPKRVRAQAAPRIAPGNSVFQRTWERTDRPVAEGRATRTWMWGPEPFTEAIQEPYAESPGGMRVVQYYDKSRMEITHPEGDSSSVWYVTNGLLVNELMTGQLQTGDATFESRSPAQVNVAGDSDDADGPTYATFAGVRSVSAGGPDALITRVIQRNGSTSTDQHYAGYNVHETQYTGETNHWIAGPFWDFMNSSGTVYENGQFATGQLFLSAYYATGFPVTDAYWARVRVGGTQKDVLVQCFERRCLTYTPDNAPEWRVEAGNVGQHYHTWRTSGNGGDGQTTISYAPSQVEAALIAEAQANAHFQTLANYITGYGFDEISTAVYQTSEDGGATTYTLVASYIENATNAGLARITYEAADSVWALLQNASGTMSFAMYVGADGQIAGAYPEEYAANATSALSARAVDTPACNQCLTKCDKTFSTIDLKIEDLCLVFAVMSCDQYPRAQQKAKSICEITAWGGCVSTYGLSICEGSCADICRSDCGNCDLETHQCCNGTCVSNTSSNHCLSCGNTCGPSNTCCHDRGCVDTWSNLDACGYCERRCGKDRDGDEYDICRNGNCDFGCKPACTGTQSCCDGECQDKKCYERDCAPACNDPQVCCSGTCVNLNTDAYCGSCDRHCDGVTHCCSGDCVDPNTDPFNCGACGTSCPEGYGCCAGVCKDLRTEENCGVCGVTCPGDGGKCCSGLCKDTYTDEANCGGCGLKCPADFTCCDGQCKDLSSDRANCGSCGKSCSGDLLCQNGQCVCADDIDCSGPDVCRNKSCVTCASVGGVACADDCCLNGKVCTNNTCKDPGCSASALALGECCQSDNDCDGSEICSNNQCVACPGSSCSDVCCYGDYPTCCPSIELCCPTGFPVCPPAGHSGCCPAGQFLCPNDQFCCGDGCTCTDTGCDCSQPCENNDDCQGSDLCMDGECVTCASAGGEPCGSTDCCGGDYPVCCGGTVHCCPAQFPVCPPSGRNWCCSSGQHLCPNEDNCCDPGCTCTSDGCDCSNVAPATISHATGQPGGIYYPLGTVPTAGSGAPQAPSGARGRPRS